MKFFFQAKNKTNFNIRRLGLIDKLVATDDLRNNLARSVAYEELINFKNFKEHPKFLEYFVAMNTSPDYVNEIMSLQASLQKMQAKQSLPNIMLEDTQFKKKNPVRLFFWVNQL